jgi:hypothetical protein
MAIQYIYKHFPFQDPPKYTKIGSIGVQIQLIGTTAQCCQTECCQTECRQTECCQTECRFYNIRPNVARLNVARPNVAWLG